MPLSDTSYDPIYKPSERLESHGLFGDSFWYLTMQKAAILLLISSLNLFMVCSHPFVRVPAWSLQLRIPKLRLEPDNMVLLAALPG